MCEWAPSSTVLDLGCGTGEDAVFLAQHGFKVTGVDPSSGMIEQAMMKAKAASVSPTFICLRAEDLSALPAGSFQGIISNFAALNNVEDFVGVLAQCARILVPGGTMILCLLNQYCLWETASFLLRGKPGKAFRRWHSDSVPANVGDGVVPVFYRSAHSVRNDAAEWFFVKRVFGLSVFAPPPSSLGFMGRFPRLSDRLSTIDRSVGRWPVLRTMGDHVVITLKRKGPATR